MSNVPAIVNIIGFIILVLAAGAGVIGYFKANVSKATIELYKEDNDALRVRIRTLEEQRNEDTAKIKALESSRTYLMSVVTQATAIAKLQETLDKICIKVGA